MKQIVLCICFLALVFNSGAGTDTLTICGQVGNVDGSGVTGTTVKLQYGDLTKETLVRMDGTWCFVIRRFTDRYSLYLSLPPDCVSLGASAPWELSPTTDNDYVIGIVVPPDMPEATGIMFAIECGAIPISTLAPTRTPVPTITLERMKVRVNCTGDIEVMLDGTIKFVDWDCEIIEE